MMDSVCLWLGRVIVLGFGIGGTVWLISWPINYAWRQMKGNVVFFKAFVAYARKGNSE